MAPDDWCFVLLCCFLLLKDYVTDYLIVFSRFVSGWAIDCTGLGLSDCSVS